MRPLHYGKHSKLTTRSLFQNENTSESKTVRKGAIQNLETSHLTPKKEQKK